MKLIFYTFVILLLTACSSEEQRFVCSYKSGTSPDGLIIKNKEATLGVISNMKLCETAGTVSIYSTKCGAKDKYASLLFDTVSFSGEWCNVDSENKYAGCSSISCVKK
jgi:hypothetical protein